MAGTSRLLEALRELRRRLDGELFPLSVGDVAADRRACRELAGQLDDYLLPRLEAIDAPLLAVVGGSTGAGKSTLVNSLAGADVTVPGVLRPTTLGPTLVANPADADWFLGRNVLPGLPRVTGHGRGEPGTLRVVTAGRAARRARARSTRPTSTRSSPPTASSPRSCSPPPTYGCSSPAPPGTPTRCRGASCAPPGSAARRSPSSSTACPPDAIDAGPRRPGPAARRERPRRRAAVHRARGGRARRAAGCPPTLVRPIADWLGEICADAAHPLRGGPADAGRGARQPRGPGARARRGGRPAAARHPRAARGRGARLRRGHGRVRRRACATGRCSAARCSPAGRTSSAPAS